MTSLPASRPRSLTRSRLATLVLAAVLPALVLAGCGGDDGGNGGSGGGNGGSGGGDADSAGSVPEMQGEDCDAQVSLTGAVSAEWDGGAKVDVTDSEVAPPATYQSNHDGFMLTVGSTGHGFDDPTVILLTDDGTSYAVPFDEGGTVEVQDDGSGATIEAEATDVAGGDPVQVSASFDC